MVLHHLWDCGSSTCNPIIWFAIAPKFSVRGNRISRENINFDPSFFVLLTVLQR